MLNNQLILKFPENVEWQQKIIWLPPVLDWFAREIQQLVHDIHIVMETTYFHIKNN